MCLLENLFGIDENSIKINSLFFFLLTKKHIFCILNLIKITMKKISLDIKVNGKLGRKKQGETQAFESCDRKL